MRLYPGQKIMIKEKMPSTKFTKFLVKDGILTSESEIQPPPYFFYIFQDILRLSKNKFRVESLKTRRKFFRPPLKRVENFLAPPPFCQVAVFNK